MRSAGNGPQRPHATQGTGDGVCLLYSSTVPAELALWLSGAFANLGFAGLFRTAVDGSMDWRAFTQPFSFWLLPLGKDPWFHDHWVPETQQYFWGRHRVPTTVGLSYF